MFCVGVQLHVHEVIDLIVDSGADSVSTHFRTAIQLAPSFQEILCCARACYASVHTERQKEILLCQLVGQISKAKRPEGYAAKLYLQAVGKFL